MTAFLFVDIAFVRISPKSTTTITFIRSESSSQVSTLKDHTSTGAPSYIFTSQCMCNCEPLCDKIIKPGIEH